MAKLKKHSGLSKVIKVRNSGTITLHHPGLNHNAGKKNGAYNRHLEKGSSMSHADYSRLKKVIK